MRFDIVDGFLGSFIFMLCINIKINICRIVQSPKTIPIVNGTNVRFRLLIVE